jgi:hypothetical protein
MIDALNGKSIEVLELILNRGCCDIDYQERGFCALSFCAYDYLSAKYPNPRADIFYYNAAKLMLRRGADWSIALNNPYHGGRCNGGRVDVVQLILNEERAYSIVKLRVLGDRAHIQEGSVLHRVVRDFPSDLLCALLGYIRVSGSTGWLSKT